MHTGELFQVEKHKFFFQGIEWQYFFGRDSGVIEMSHEISHQFQPKMFF